MEYDPARQAGYDAPKATLNDFIDHQRGRIPTEPSEAFPYGLSDADIKRMVADHDGHVGPTELARRYFGSAQGKYYQRVLAVLRKNGRQHHGRSAKSAKFHASRAKRAVIAAPATGRQGAVAEAPRASVTRPFSGDNAVTALILSQAERLSEVVRAKKTTEITRSIDELTLTLSLASQMLLASEAETNAVR